MTKIEIEFDSNDNGVTIVAPRPDRNLLNEYIAMAPLENQDKPQSFNRELHLPIKDVRVAHLSTCNLAECLANSSKCAGSKPCYLYAEILPTNLRRGQSTITNTKLAEKIRRRGKEGDDCGHIIGALLGGKMVEFNLFPQSKTINRGYGRPKNLRGQGVEQLWRQGVEQVMAKWLTLPEQWHPKALFEIILFYTDTDYPDRPNKTKFVVTLECDREEEEEDDDGDGKTCLHPVLKAQLLNELTVDVEKELSAFEKINWHNFSCHFGNNDKKFARFLKEILIAILVEEFGTLNPTIAEPTPKPFSWWDIIPIVGDVRRVIQGVEDAKDGHSLRAAANIALGLGGCTLTILTIGSACSLITSGTNLGAKMAVKEGGKQVATIAAKEWAKEAGKETVVATITCAQQALKFSQFVLNRNMIC